MHSKTFLIETTVSHMTNYKSGALLHGDTTNTTRRESCRLSSVLKNWIFPLKVGYQLQLYDELL